MFDEDKVLWIGEERGWEEEFSCLMKIAQCETVPLVLDHYSSVQNEPTEILFVSFMYERRRRRGGVWTSESV